MSTLSIISDKIDILPSDCGRRVGGLQNARSVTKVRVNVQERKENGRRHRVFLWLILEQFKTVAASTDREKPVSGQENKGKVRDMETCLAFVETNFEVGAILATDTDLLQTRIFIKMMNLNMASNSFKVYIINATVFITHARSVKVMKKIDTLNTFILNLAKTHMKYN